MLRGEAPADTDTGDTHLDRDRRLLRRDHPRAAHNLARGAHRCPAHPASPCRGGSPSTGGLPARTPCPCRRPARSVRSCATPPPVRPISFQFRSCARCWAARTVRTTTGAAQRIRRRDDNRRATLRKAARIAGPAITPLRWTSRRRSPSAALRMNARSLHEPSRCWSLTRADRRHDLAARALSKSFPGPTSQMGIGHSQSCTRQRPQACPYAEGTPSSWARRPI